MEKQTYIEIAEVIYGVAKKNPQCANAIGKIVHELSVYFLDKDPNFSTSIFVSACCPESFETEDFHGN